MTDQQSRAAFEAWWYRTPIKDTVDPFDVWAAAWSASRSAPVSAKPHHTGVIERVIREYQHHLDKITDDIGAADMLDGEISSLKQVLAILAQPAPKKPKRTGNVEWDAVLGADNPDFTKWRESMPKDYWAEYDLSACRLGWEAHARSAPVAGEVEPVAWYEHGTASVYAGTVPPADGPSSKWSPLYAAPVRAVVPEALTFDAWRKANVTRCLKWHPKGINSWSASDWMTAIVGELGELAGLIKMRNRERDGLAGNKFSPTDLQIAKEAADTFAYLDLFCAAHNIDLAAASVEKFNEVSERVGFPDRIELSASPSPPPAAEVDYKGQRDALMAALVGLRKNRAGRLPDCYDYCNEYGHVQHTSACEAARTAIEAVQAQESGR